MTTVVIACQTIEDEINAIYKTLVNPSPIYWVESGLHNFPNKLKDRIQQELDKVHGADNILLLFGYCGNSIEGLMSSEAQLVVPKVDDCISLLLGGNKIRLELSHQAPAYYLTDGWLRYDNNIYQEYQRCKEKYGPVKALLIFRAMLAHYSTLNFIDTGTYNLELVISKTAELAANLNLEQKVVTGSLNLIAKALREEWDDDFLKVPPGVRLHIDYCSTTGPNQH